MLTVWKVRLLSKPAARYELLLEAQALLIEGLQRDRMLRRFAVWQDAAQLMTA